MPFATPNSWCSTPVDNETVLWVCLQLGLVETRVVVAYWLEIAGVVVRNTLFSGASEVVDDMHGRVPGLLVRRLHTLAQDARSVRHDRCRIPCEPQDAADNLPIALGMYTSCFSLRAANVLSVVGDLGVLFL